MARTRHTKRQSRPGPRIPVPARLPLGQVSPGQQLLDVQTKVITHAIRIAAFHPNGQPLRSRVECACIEV